VAVLSVASHPIWPPRLPSCLVGFCQQAGKGSSQYGGRGLRFIARASSTLPCSRRPRRCCRTAMTDLKDLTEEAAIAGDTREIRVTRGQQRFASWVTDVLVYIVVLGLFVE